MSLKHVSSLSHRLWEVALARVVVGTGSAGVELLVIVIINGRFFIAPLLEGLLTVSRPCTTLRAAALDKCHRLLRDNWAHARRPSRCCVERSFRLPPVSMYQSERATWNCVSNADLPEPLASNAAAWSSPLLSYTSPYGYHKCKAPSHSMLPKDLNIRLRHFSSSRWVCRCLR
jgi:hypothetical protein